MSTHEEIVQQIRKQIDVTNAEKTQDLSPEIIALRVYSCFANGNEDVHIRHGCVEAYKAMARRVLAREFGADEEDETKQSDMFAGHLQERYPIRTPAGAEPVYRIREALSNDDLDWNIQRLMKVSHAARKHAEALTVFRNSRNEMSVAA